MIDLVSGKWRTESRSNRQHRWGCDFRGFLIFVSLHHLILLSQVQLEAANPSEAIEAQSNPADESLESLPKAEASSSILSSLLGTGNSTQAEDNPTVSHSEQAGGQPRASTSATTDKVTLPGDILLGGLFPIHMKGTKVECGAINRDRGIQRLEAMLYALDRINEDESLLPGIKLGGILLDSCSSSTYALNQSLEFIRASINTVESSAFECKDKSTPRPKYGSKMIAGVVGGSYSEVSLQVANLLRLFRISQVSYASTGTALSDKTLYDLFARTVPSDMFQARAIADIVLRLRWSYVSLVSSEGLYGDSGSKEFAKQAQKRNICIATHEKISPTIDHNAYDSIVSNLFKRNATGVVLFTRAEDTRDLLLAVKRANLHHNFAWVAADGWGTHQNLVEGVEEVAWGAITVELQAKAIPGFDQYMKGLTPWVNQRNPWFSEYWQEWFQCQLQANLLQQQQVASGQAYAASAAAKHREFAAVWSKRDQDDASGEPNLGRRRRGTSQIRQAQNCSIKHSSFAHESCETPIKGSKEAATIATTVDETPTTTDDTYKQVNDSSLARGARSLNSKATQFCSPNLRISETNGYRQEQKVQFVVDAVYAMAHALHKAWHELCGAQPGVVCENLKELNGGEFYSRYLLNVSFKDLAGSEVKFDASGDGLGRYNIYNFRQVGAASSSSSSADLSEQFASTTDEADTENVLEVEGSRTSGPSNNLDLEPLDGPQAQAVSYQQGSGSAKFEYSSIGRWTEDEYDLRIDDIQFIRGEHGVPESYCSRPCELGQAKIMRAGDQCCWICKTCAPYEYLPDEFSCHDCGIGRWPVANKKSCFDLPQKYLRWDSVYSIISLSVAGLGLAITSFVTIIFIKYIDTPVVKASGRESSFILLAGIACCHLATPVLLSRPTAFICGSQRFLVNFGFSVMYASLLVKTNRISRIFNCARKTAKRPSFISPRSQMIITGILVAIQTFLTIIWFVFEPPGTRADSPEGKRDEVILKCKAKGKSFIISLIYNMILITTCTVYAVKTRKIPENFNESKFIGFTMYTTIVIWLAFVTMFFGTNNSHEIQINTMCICVSLSAYVTLFCLFSPKISIILLHPDKNVRKLTMNSATYKRPFKPIPHATASAEARINATSATYNGAHIDGCSGGPMSTTSQVLNLAESQAARMQESSVGSNVNSSGGSQGVMNGGKRTPSTLSQHLQLGGTCASCGAHQQAQLVSYQQQTNSPAVELAAGRAARFNVSSHVGLGAPSGQSCISLGVVASKQAATAIAVSNAMAASKTNSQRHPGAKIVHHVRPNQVGRCLSSDQQEHFRACQTRLAKSTGRVNDTDESDGRKQELEQGSLTRLNASSSNNINGSISSFGVNDSCPNTSQENTPCSGPNSKRHRIFSEQDFECPLGSDSALWNQSVYSIDYCSDCCPSYCGYCSCQSNGAEEFASLDQDAQNVAIRSTQHAFEDIELLDSSLTDSHRAIRQAQQTTSSSLDLSGESPCASLALSFVPNRRRKSELHSLAPRDSSQHQQTHFQRQATRRSQTMEMKTIGIFTALSSHRDVDQPRGGSKKSRSEEEEPNPVGASPVAYALQAAASSALSACTIEARLAVGDRRPGQGRRTNATVSRDGCEASDEENESRSSKHHNQENVRRSFRRDLASRSARGSSTASVDPNNPSGKSRVRRSTRRQPEEREQTSSSNEHELEACHPVEELPMEDLSSRPDKWTARQVKGFPRQESQRALNEPPILRSNSDSKQMGDEQETPRELGANQVAMIGLALNRAHDSGSVSQASDTKSRDTSAD